MIYKENKSSKSYQKIYWIIRDIINRNNIKKTQQVQSNSDNYRSIDKLLLPSPSSSLEQYYFESKSESQTIRSQVQLSNSAK